MPNPAQKGRNQSISACSAAGSGDPAGAGDERTEFKLLLDNKEKIATEIVAFANAQGGWMLFGVDDTGSVQGVADAAALERDLTNLCRQNCIPITGSQIRLFIFDDRLEVYSPGRLPNIVTLENVRYGAHYERNSRLCTVLTHLGFMSDIGTGIPRTIRLTKRLSGREPEFELRGEEFIVRIYSAF